MALWLATSESMSRSTKLPCVIRGRPLMMAKSTFGGVQKTSDASGS